jgi:hypothetical protein
MASYIKLLQKTLRLAKQNKLDLLKDGSEVCMLRH